MVITEKAQQQIANTLQDSEFLRIEVSGGGCSGFTVGLAKVGGTEESDIWLRDNVVIDTASEGYLSEATLDWIEDPFQPTFKFDIPDTHACGCGSSFQFS